MISALLSLLRASYWLPATAFESLAFESEAFDAEPPESELFDSPDSFEPSAGAPLPLRFVL